MKSLIRNLTTIAVLSGLHLIGWCIYYPKYISSLSEWSHWISFMAGGIVIGGVLLLMLILWSIQGVWSYYAHWTEMKDYVLKTLSMLMIYLPIILIQIDSPYFYFLVGSVSVSMLVIALDYFEIIKSIFRQSLQV